MKNLFEKLLPYILGLFLGGGGFILIEVLSGGALKLFIVNIAASLIAISIIFISYETISHFSEAKMRNKIRKYVIFNMEKSFFVFIRYFYTWFYGDQKTPLFLDDKKINDLLSLLQNDIEHILAEKRLMGFFIYKNITGNIDFFAGIIKNPNLNKYVTDDEMLRLMDIYGNVSDFILKKDDNPNSPLLGLYYDDVKIDSGLFNETEQKKLLLYLKPATEHIELIASQLVQLFKDIQYVIDLMSIDFWEENYAYGIKIEHQ